MTLTELRYIVAVARERHFGRAAEGCFVSQPTLSVAVKKLEEELGLQLFERGPGEVTITPAGQKIVEQAQRVLEEASRIKELAAAGRDPLAGPLRLGAIYTIGPYLLPKLIPILRRAAPQMQLHIQENFTHVLAELLKNGEDDVILVGTEQSFARYRQARIDARTQCLRTAPLRSQIVRVNYAKAQDLLPHIRAGLSERGSVSYDARTNTLIVRDVDCD